VISFIGPLRMSLSAQVVCLHMSCLFVCVVCSVLYFFFRSLLYVSFVGLFSHRSCFCIRLVCRRSVLAELFVLFCTSILYVSLIYICIHINMYIFMYTYLYINTYIYR